MRRRIRPYRLATKAAFALLGIILAWVAGQPGIVHPWPYALIGIVCFVALFELVSSALWPAIEQARVLPPTLEPRPRPGWNTRRRPNAYFAGRGRELRQLHDRLRSGDAGGEALVIHGPGGMGKTELALQYACRYEDDYDLIWWLHCEEAATLAEDYMALAQQVDVGIRDVSDPELVRRAVRAWLQRSDGWLLVFDNAAGADDLDDYLPGGTSGHVLVTTQNRNWPGLQTLSLEPLTCGQARDLLLERTKQDNEVAAAELAEELGYFPLALEQAGAYVVETGMSLAGYLELFRERTGELLGKGRPAGYEETLLTTWNLAFEQVSIQARALLNLCAFLAPDDMPLRMIREGSDLLPKPLRACAADELALEEAVADLRRYSLVEREADLISIHRLVQTVLRERLEEGAQKKWAEATVGLVAAVFPGGKDDPGDVRNWPLCAALMPHGMAAAGHAERLEVAAEETGLVLNQAGVHLRSRALLSQARNAHQRALKVDLEAYGPDHPAVATDLNNLATVLKEQGDLEGAKEKLERALKVDLEAYGPDHRAVARDLNNLATVLQDQGDLDGAKEKFERALEIDKGAYGPEHPTVATRLNNLAMVLGAQGDLEGAREKLECALEIDLDAYGPDHPTVAIRLNNLALVLRDEADLSQARDKFERALEIRRDRLGVEHPLFAQSLNNLAGVLGDHGDLEGAREKLERALEIDLEAYGPNHPAMARDLNNLAMVLRDQDDLEGAREKFERALEIHLGAYGPYHPAVARDLNNLAMVLKEQGDLEGAKEKSERALEIDMASYGPDHPAVATNLNNLAMVLKDQGDLEGAQEKQERTLEVFEKTLGPEHPNTEVARNNLEMLKRLEESPPGGGAESGAMPDSPEED
ncbi:MAG: FxSxx-COOH system tetratricopeptide repeat protein [Candidatus Brocadiia bacterium]